MHTLGHLRMKCWKEYVDQGDIMTGWISIHMRSVCRDSEQFKYTVFSLTLKLLDFVPFKVLSSTFYTLLPAFLPIFGSIPKMPLLKYCKALPENFL
jgi:hypothetical protein